MPPTSSFGRCFCQISKKCGCIALRLVFDKREILACHFFAEFFNTRVMRYNHRDHRLRVDKLEMSSTIIDLNVKFIDFPFSVCVRSLTGRFALPVFEAEVLRIWYFLSDFYGMFQIFNLNNIFYTK